MGVVHDADVTEGERERLVIEMIQIEGGGVEVGRDSRARLLKGL